MLKHPDAGGLFDKILSPLFSKHTFAQRYDKEFYFNVITPHYLF